MPKTRLPGRAALLAAAWLFAASSFAAPPQKILYQGTLRRSGSVYTGNAAFVFRLTDSSGGTEYWTSGSTVVPVSMGLFRYPIGTDNAGGTGLSGKPLSGVDWPNITPYIEVTVDGTVLTPREAMASVPYALSNDDSKVLKTGDAMTGPLTLSGSTLTISGNAFSVGGSSFTVLGGSAAVAYQLAAGSIISGASITASAFFGYGGNLTGLPSSEINTYVSSKTFMGNVLAGGSITASAFFGYGGNLTGISAAETNTYASSKTFTANAFSVGGSTFVVAGGNVGIGTTNPATTLEVNGGAQFGQGSSKSTFTSTGDLILASGSSITLSGANGFISAGSSITASAFFGYGGNLTGISPGESNTYASSKTFTANAFSVGGSTLVVAGGNVGIGTTGPDIAGWGSTRKVVTILGTSLNSVLELASNQGDVAGSRIGTLSFVKPVNTGGVELAQIEAYTEGATAANRGAYLTFLTKSDGGALANRMRIDGTGSVGIGTTGPAYLLDVSGGMIVRSSMTMSNMAAPPVSVAGQGSIYFDTGLNQFMVSENTGGYTALLGGGGSFVAKAGDRMTGPLTMFGGSTITVSGNAFSVGVSTLVVAEGNVGIGTSSPATKLQLSSGTLTVDGTGAAIRTSGNVFLGSGLSTAFLTLNGAAGSQKVVQSQTAGLTRWQDVSRQLRRRVRGQRREPFRAVGRR